MDRLRKSPVAPGKHPGSVVADRAFAEQDLKTSVEGLKDYKDRKISEAAKWFFTLDFEKDVETVAMLISKNAESGISPLRIGIELKNREMPARGERAKEQICAATKQEVNVPSQDDDFQSASDNEETGDLKGAEHAIVDLTQIAKELQQEPRSEWVVDDINVTQIF
ncbi:hypothetical protein BC937DRAFT_94434 [Endogone sp. FLAS-F59071]|nr:hypothetical protein BC937DRAFT_94434 [Endogone sp. FLAS-F59071]|eukprot:RUS20768.1 hypothetical protein BC937DRAFT_94434 [Endogone sp. FLAS-F59071]